MGPGDTADLRGLICASCARHSSYWDAAPLTLDVLPADVHHGDHSYETPLTPVLRGVFIEHENGDHAVDDGGFRFPKQARFDQHRTILPAPILPASSAAAALMTGRGKLPLRDARLPFLPVFRSSILRRLWALRVLNPDVPESVHVLKSLSPMKPLSSLAAPPPARSAALKAWSALQHQQISPQGSLLGFGGDMTPAPAKSGKRAKNRVGFDLMPPSGSAFKSDSPKVWGNGAATKKGTSSKQGANSATSKKGIPLGLPPWRGGDIAPSGSAFKSDSPKVSGNGAATKKGTSSKQGANSANSKQGIPLGLPPWRGKGTTLHESAIVTNRAAGGPSDARLGADAVQTSRRPAIRIAPLMQTNLRVCPRLL